MEIIQEDTVPGGAYWSRVVRRGTTLRLTDLGGSMGVAALLYNADDPSERYNAPDTVKIQNQIHLTTGKVLFSDMGRILCSITADTCGHHDTLGGCSTPETVAAQFGAGDYQTLRNGRHTDARTNFLYALGRHGMGMRDLVPNVNFFTRARVEPDGRLVWVQGGTAGSHVDLRAEMNVLVVLSNTPHPLHPGGAWSPTPVRCTVVASPAPAHDDPCRTAGPEAIRGFRNTDALFAG